MKVRGFIVYQYERQIAARFDSILLSLSSLSTYVLLQCPVLRCLRYASRPILVLSCLCVFIHPASMVLHTRSVVLKVALRSQQKLQCRFSVDHKGPKFKVGWRAQIKGDWVELYSHDSHSGVTRGSGVNQKGLLSTGDATLSIPFVKISSEGKYVCSVSVGQLDASLDLALHVYGELRTRDGEVVQTLTWCCTSTLSLG